MSTTTNKIKTYSLSANGPCTRWVIGPKTGRSRPSRNGEVFEWTMVEVRRVRTLSEREMYLSQPAGRWEDFAPTGRTRTEWDTVDGIYGNDIL